MVKVRVLIMISTIIIVGAITAFAVLYARGFRLERNASGSSVSLLPKGLLVANSEPTGAQVFVDDELKTATNNTIPVDPGEHKLRVQKDGFNVWEKDILVTKETVTQTNSYLIPSAPSLTALSFNGVVNPQVSRDLTKIAYAVPKTTKNQTDKVSGLWLYETTNLPLGFSRDPKQITNADLSTFTWEWSPDGREILVASKSATYLLPVNDFTDAKDLINVSNQVTKIKQDWQKSQDEKLSAQLGKLEPKLRTVFQTSATDITFSPDETKILYTASVSASIPTGLVKELPGSSTQKESRDITPKVTYIYDIKEDKNFEVDNEDDKVYWIQNSLNIVIPKKDRIVVKDYDGTNEQTVFAGNYVFPFAFPTTSTSKMVILTSFGATGSLPNLYWLSLK